MRTKPGLVAIGLLAAVLFLRLPLLLAPGPGRDEAAYHYWAHHPEPAYAPLLAALVRATEWMTGPGLVALRLPVLLAGLLVLVVVDRRLAAVGSPPRARLLALLAVGLSPWQAWTGSFLHPDALLLSCALIATWTFARGRVLLTAGAAIAGALAKPTGLLLLPLAFWWAGRVPRAVRGRVVVARGTLLAVALLAAASLTRAMLAEMAQFGRVDDGLPLLARLGAWSVELVFLGGPLLLALGVVGARERIERARAPGDGVDRREARASLLVAGALLGLFAVAMLARGQFKANWILPAFVLLLPMRRPAWPRALTGAMVAAGLLLTLAQTAALTRPDWMEQAERALEVPSWLAYEGHRSVREQRVSTSRSWSDQLRSGAGVEVFARAVFESWSKGAGEPGPPRWIVSDDYGLAAQLQWHLDHDGVRLAIVDDGVFHRTIEDFRRSAPVGPVLVLPVHGPVDLPVAPVARHPLEPVPHPLSADALALEAVYFEEPSPSVPRSPDR